MLNVLYVKDIMKINPRHKNIFDKFIDLRNSGVIFATNFLLNRTSSIFTIRNASWNQKQKGYILLEKSKLRIMQEEGFK